MSVILASSSLLVAASPSSEVHRDFNISSAYIETRNSFSNDDLCSENSLFLGHGGSRLIAFYRSRGRLVDVQIVSHDGGRLSYFPDMRSATLRGRTFVSINSLLPVAITRDGFVSRSASSRFLAFRESGSEMGADSVKITDLPRMQFLHVAGADTDQSSLVYARHLVRNILRNYRTSDLRTDASAGLVSNIGASFRWYKYPSLDAPANATGSFFRDYKFLFRQIYDPKVVVRNGHDSLIGLGEIDGGDNHAAFEIPGSSAIIDPRTGTLAGSFNEKMMRVRVGGKYTTFSAPKLGRILDAAVSGQSVAWLYQEADHRVLKWRNGAKEVQIRTRCPIEPREDKGDLDFWTGQQATAWIPPIVRDYALLDLGQKTRVLPAQFYQNSDRSIIIFFGGGPTNPLTLSGAVDLFPQLGNQSILSMSYSGQLGGGLEMQGRLLNGGKALSEDAEQVSQFLETRKFENITIVGASFGALPAMALKSRLGKRARLLLVSPIVSVGPDQNDRAEFGETSKSGQRRFMLELFGSPGKVTDFQSWIENLYMTTAWSDKDTLHISTYDQPFPDPIAVQISKGGAHVNYVSLPHGRVFSAKGVWGSVFSD
jgi:pimeloyl-ACP methyl ester carboxylesterase